MPSRPSARRLSALWPVDVSLRPEAIAETVVHDPEGSPWLVCTANLELGVDAAEPDGAEHPSPGRYQTQVYYTARGGIRGFPTGHGARYDQRGSAVSGHRRWCLFVRTGEVRPDLVPEHAL